MKRKVDSENERDKAPDMLGGETGAIRLDLSHLRAISHGGILQ